MQSALSPFEWGVKVRMRDGIHLNATVYSPGQGHAPGPAILAVTPYVSDVYHAEGVYFASRGFAFVVVDSRGRGNSEGVFRPGIQEAADGCELIHWLACQPYCNGKVGMFGGSYSGYAQWAAAKEFPPQLCSMVPIAATFYGVHVPMRNNVFYPERLRWLMLTSGRTNRARLHADASFWAGVCARWHKSGRPFRDLDDVAGNPSPVFQEWLTHPEPDAFLDEYNPSNDQYARLSLPVLTITGSYDVDQPGALEHYKRHVANCSNEARALHFLVIGPWNHSGAQLPRAQFGGLTFSENSVVDMRELHRQWYSWTLQDGARPEFLKNNVAYYVMGAEQWRYADTLAAVTARHDCYFLDSDGRANDVFHSGDLLMEESDAPPDSYTYDPRETHGLEVDAESCADDQSLLDQSLTLALRGRQLVYHTAPLASAIEVTGFFRLRAWLSIDCPDTDFYVSVYEIGADGLAVILGTDVLRARYREGLRSPKLIETPAPLPYEFNSFTFVSRVVSRGHRLRLVIAPLGRIDMTFVQKNYNGGGVVSEESAAEARAVTVRLFHDSAHPSALYVPIGRSE